MNKKNQSTLSGTPVLQNEGAKRKNPILYKLIENAFRTNKRILIVGGIILFVFVIIFTVTQFLLSKSQDHELWKVLSTFALNVSASLLAAWFVAILAGLLLFSEAAEQKRQIEVAQYIEDTANSTAQKIPKPEFKVNLPPITNAINSLESTVQQWRNLNTCKFEDMCPKQLRALRETLMMGSSTPST
ncbi:hypothetical protein KA005_71640 [bacterium]|nr:hypothetical protein [bacterium]